MMETLRLTQKIRPTRFLFLVSETEETQADLAFRLNSALWAGILNPIVSIEQDSNLIKKMFQAYHVDFAINLSNQKLPTELTKYFGRQLRPPEEFVSKDDKGISRFHLGSDVRPILSSYWERYGRHLGTPRDASDQDFALVIGTDDSWEKYALLVAGGYPEGFEYDYATRYREVTKCKSIILDDNTVVDLASPTLTTPVEFTIRNLILQIPSRWSDWARRVIYVGQIDKVRDRLEFWNLRALGQQIFFLPWDNIPPFLSLIKYYIKEGTLKPSDEIMNETVFQKSSTLEKKHFEKAIKGVKGLVSDLSKTGSRDWLPDYGIAILPRMDEPHGSPPLESILCYAHEQDDLVHIFDNRIDIKIAFPEYLTPYRSDWNRSFGICLSAQEPLNADIWFNFPSNASIAKLLGSDKLLISDRFKLCPRENLVLLQNTLGSSVFSMELPKTFEVFAGFFSDFGLTITDYSEKGRFALGIEQAIGGYWDAMRFLRDAGVYDLLMRLSKNEGTYNLIRREMVKTVAETSQRVQQSSGADSQKIAASIVDGLINKRILRAGLEFKCINCYRQGWYDITQFDNEFTCHYCFEKQQTPILDGHNWRYRASGLFGTRDVGEGSLPVIYTSLFFRRQFPYATRHLYSFKGTSKTLKEREIDLALIRTDYNQQPDIAICECKSSRFTKQDFDKLADVSKMIPGAVSCAATFNEHFSKEEKLWANDVWESSHPLILLTRLELESSEIKLDGIPDRYRYPQDFSSLAYATRIKFLGWSPK